MGAVAVAVGAMARVTAPRPATVSRFAARAEPEAPAEDLRGTCFPRA